MSPAPPGGPRCERCLGRGEACLCDQLTALPTRTAVLVVQHALEVSRVSGTVRFAALALERCQVLPFGDPKRPLALPPLDGAWLVFPGEGPAVPPGPPPSTLVFLDGSWSQARRMAQRLGALRALPRLSLAAGPAPRLREGPPGTMSTLEAMAAALALVESPKAGAHLRAVHDLVCRRQLSLRGYVGAPGGT